MGGLHKELNPNLISVIKFSLCLTGYGGDIVDSKLKLIFFEDIEQVFINQTLRKQLQHLQVAMICITKACILKGRIVDGPCLIEQIKCNFCCTDRLLF